MLFIQDPESKGVNIPEYVKNEIVAATDSCISVATQAPCDGDVEVALTQTKATLGNLLRLGSWELSTASGRLAVVAADDELILEQRVPRARTTVSVWVDDLKGPAKVSINIED